MDRERMRLKLPVYILAGLIFIAIITVCVMVKFASEISVDDKIREDIPAQDVFRFTKDLGLIRITDNSSSAAADRFPYVAAVTRNSSSNWEFVCFASVILVKWIVTSAHCRTYGSIHRVFLYHDFANNFTHTYPVMFWRLHEGYDGSSWTLKYDIAVAKLNLNHMTVFTLQSAIIRETAARDVVASIWKTVSTMDKKLYLTNDFDQFPVKIASPAKCYEKYGVSLDESLFCADLSDYEDCFIHEFGPIFSKDTVIGIIATKPRDCEVKVAIFTNVSYYTTWILKSTRILPFR